MSLVYKKPLVPLDLKKVYFIILHHIDAARATPDDIHRWHIERGFSGAGYNEYIRKDGTRILLRGDHIGAHCEGMNSKSYGVAVEGDYDVEPNMPDKQMAALVVSLQENITRFPNKIEVVKHSKFIKTACPGVFFPFDKIMSYLDDELCKAIDKFYDHNLINSPNYWLTNAKEGRTVDGAYARSLIVSTAAKLK